MSNTATKGAKMNKWTNIVTEGQARNIKNEVYALGNRDIKVNYTKAGQDTLYKKITIIAEGIDLEDKTNAIKLLNEYNKDLNMRLFNNAI